MYPKDEEKEQKRMMTVEEVRKLQRVNYYKIINEIEEGRLRAIPFPAANGKTTYRIEEADYEAWKKLKKATVQTRPDLGSLNPREHLDYLINQIRGDGRKTRGIRKNRK